ncbi:hypothetical protein D187_007351 [Cystobacter fuscus DSM 2262]|uniref:Uncharacterized protein n=1 Tax=Cystobacter fuscus (strain ATCC 25194 / DSM 2262 / NBRC 100088 / M29) TaxID=1242864 RepID=S9Q3X6_CYSF2|nr:hypothetical protein [Cystobacter fuscus]EPX56009.1 hypothetical protein D187_007351 [Cystobacter fuscus DSM 2262]
MLPLQRWLSSDEAAAYLRPYTAFRRVGARIGMDVDPQVLSFGSNNSGAGLFTGGRVPSLSLVNPKGSTFIEGDLYVDGWLENPGGLVFVRGNLMAQTLYTSGYLVVLGELRVRRLFGEDEPLGTYVFGDAYVESAIFNHNHPFDVWGKAELGDLVHDETHGREAVRERLAAQGVLSSPRYEDFLVDVQMGLRNQAERWGSLPEDWVARKYTPKPGDIDAGKLPPPRLGVVLELERWLATTQLTQRQQLEELRAHWRSRLTDAEVRPEATRIIRKAINSKKLAEERDALLRTLD